MKIKIAFILTAVFLFSGCKKETDTNDFKDLKGAWYNNTTDFDAIIFENDSTLVRKNLISGSALHHYKIQIHPDVIVIEYTGFDKIMVPASTKKYTLNGAKDQLYIEDFSQYYPYYEGNQFTKIKDY
jgi:hypothetical protein